VSTLARRSIFALFFTAPVVGLAIAACSSSSSSTPTCGDLVACGDGAIEASPDVSPDASPDAAPQPDAAPDGSTSEASPDATPETSPDATPYTTVGSWSGTISHLVVGGGYVYFDGFGTGAKVGRLPTGGGTIATFDLPSGQSAGLLAVDAANLYVASAGGELYKIAHGSTTPQRMADLYTVGAANALASDGTNLWWTQQDGAVMRVPIAAATSVEAGVRVSIVQYPTGVAFAGSTVYVSDHGPMNAGQIEQLTADGGATPLIPAAQIAQPWPYALISDGHRLYWIEGSAGGGSETIASALLDGGAIRHYTSNATYASIATDGTSLYYMEGGVGAAAISRGPVDGSGGTTVTMTALYRNLGYTASTLAVDATSLYWADYDHGVVYKAPK
jgi:hypothetical protein